MERRLVLATLVAAALGRTAPVLAEAPAARKPFVIGLLPDFREGDPSLKLLTSLLGELGRVEGRDFVYFRSGVFYGGDNQTAIDRVMASRPDLILATNLGFVVAAHKLAPTLPIVMRVSGFPVEGGVAESLARPGKNVTGMTIYVGGEFFGKLVQLVRDAKPDIKRVGVFMSYVPPFHPRAEADLIIKGMRDVARPLGLDVRIFEIAKPEHIDQALAAVVAEHIDALVLTSDPVMARRMSDIFRFAVEHRLPTIIDAPWRELGPPRPLLAYMADFGELMRQAAPYVNKILWQGAKPGELPIQLPSRFVFDIDLATAKMIGLTVPQPLLMRADRVFE